MNTILVINGPNLNLLGRREPEIYGDESLDDIMNNLKQLANQLGTEIDTFQSNVEGEIINRIHQSMDDGTDAIIINPGAFTHTSIAIRDAFLAVDKLFVEVHLSNVFAREDFRQISFLSDIAETVISGAGKQTYELGLRTILTKLGRI